MYKQMVNKEYLFLFAWNVFCINHIFQETMGFFVSKRKSSVSLLYFRQGITVITLSNYDAHIWYKCYSMHKINACIKFYFCSYITMKTLVIGLAVTLINLWKNIKNILKRWIQIILCMTENISQLQENVNNVIL